MKVEVLPVGKERFDLVEPETSSRTERHRENLVASRE